ncbi:hypothetical protein KFK09_002206 [Dendrobium nobile]|uniref:Retrotransposon gag domain-containing protein n=1 Tax=Dendrobium nobile TaxID=94219 RepID=A0A8T3CD48_DENNO|nr:hypothetical protein KFK09_002206 [Dendrobium nobile]
MTDKGKGPATEDDRSFETLWENQATILRRLEDLSADVQRLSFEMRREIHLNRIRTPHQPPRREPAPKRVPGGRRGLDLDRQWRQALPPMQDASDSEEELQFEREAIQSELADDDECLTYNAGPNRHRRRPAPPRTETEFKVKVDISFFDGHLHIEDYLDWEKAVKNFFDYMDIEASKQVKYVACRLRSGASAWWTQLLQMRQRELKGPVRSLARMKQLLHSQFLPTDYEQILYMRYQHCVQGNRSVSEYSEEFHRLSARNNLNESTNQLVARYIGGIKESIQDKLQLNSV